MGIFKWLFLLFLVVPLAEILLLIKVGGVIGALPTVALVVLTAVIGAALIRRQGLSTIARIQNELASGQVPAEAMLEGALLLVAGALLMTPGFVTDAFGFTLLVPRARRLLIRSQVHRITGLRVSGEPPPGRQPRRAPPGRGHVIEGEYERHEGPN